MTEILAGGFLPGVKPHWREDSIFDASGSVSGKTDPFVWIERHHCLDESDRADGDQIFGVFGQMLIFFDNMCHKAQIMFDEDVFCFQVSLCIFLQILAFFVGREGLWK